MHPRQWRSQSLEVGYEVWGRKSPNGVQGQSPGGGLRVKPEARYAYTICSGQTHFRDVFIEDIRCTFRLMWSVLPHPYSSKKLFEFVPISRPILCPPVPHRGYATDLRRCAQVPTCNYIQGGPKKRGHYVWMLISSKRMNQFVWFLADFKVILLWTHLLTL